MSRGIDFSKIQPEPEEPEGPKRHIVHLPKGMSIEEFLEQSKRAYPFYGLLLPSQRGDSPINTYIRTSWEQINLMSGSACLLLTTLVPEQPTQEMRKLLLDLVGQENANQAWKEYRYSPQKVANDVYTLAQRIQLDYRKLPCLVLMADLDSKQQLILRLPEWDEEHLPGFFEAAFTRINSLVREPDPQKRYSALKAELGLGFKLRQQAEHVAGGVRETLAHVEWSEVIQSTLTNKELMATAFKVFLGVLGVAAL